MTQQFIDRWNRRRHQREADYPEALAVWQIEHGTDYRDLTPAQAERWRLHVRCVDQGMEPTRVTFARRLVADGRLTEDDTEARHLAEHEDRPTEQMIRRNTWPDARLEGVGY